MAHIRQKLTLRHIGANGFLPCLLHLPNLLLCQPIINHKGNQKSDNNCTITHHNRACPLITKLCDQIIHHSIWHNIDQIPLRIRKTITINMTLLTGNLQDSRIILSLAHSRLQLLHILLWTLIFPGNLLLQTLKVVFPVRIAIPYYIRSIRSNNMCPARGIAVIQGKHLINVLHGKSRHQRSTFPPIL